MQPRRYRDRWPSPNELHDFRWINILLSNLKPSFSSTLHAFDYHYAGLPLQPALLGSPTLNGLISASKCGGSKVSLRTVHAYVGTGAMALLPIHAILGLKLGVSF